MVRSKWLRKQIISTQLQQLLYDFFQGSEETEQSPELPTATDSPTNTITWPQSYELVVYSSGESKMVTTDFNASPRLPILTP